MRLLFDIGNHRLKWATSEQLDTAVGLADQHIYTDGPDFAARLAQIAGAVAPPEAVAVASVAAARVNDRVASWVDEVWGLEADFVVSAAEACGVTNAYDCPSALGVDRWAAIIAACLRGGAAPVLVIDAGTTVTIDYVGADRVFRGGVILPGHHAMRTTLNRCTARIRPPAQARDSVAFGLQNPNTPGAVENGSRLALVGAVEHAMAFFAGPGGQELRTFVTGGDAKWLRQSVDNAMELVCGLVLEGVQALAGGGMRR